MKNRELLTLDEAMVLEIAQNASEELLMKGWILLFFNIIEAIYG